MKKTLISFLFIAFFAVSCSKEDAAPTSKPKENPVSSFVSDAEWVRTSNLSTVKYELGYIFSAITKGKITELSAQMADPGVYTISVWEEGTKKLLRQKSVEQTSPNKFSTGAIDELIIEKDKKYVVSINSTVGGVIKSYNILKKKVNPAATIFPISKGSVIVQKSVYSNSGVSVFPEIDYTSSNGFYGFADITFIPE